MYKCVSWGNQHEGEVSTIATTKENVRKMHGLMLQDRWEIIENGSLLHCVAYNISELEIKTLSEWVPKDTFEIVC